MSKKYFLELHKCGGSILYRASIYFPYRVTLENTCEGPSMPATILKETQIPEGVMVTWDESESAEYWEYFCRCGGVAV